jgi:hypothetical protein
VAIAAIVNFRTASTFVCSNVFLFREALQFKTGFSTGLALTCMGAVAATVMWVGCRAENCRRNQRMRDLPATTGYKAETSRDMHLNTRYVL